MKERWARRARENEEGRLAPGAQTLGGCVFSLLDRSLPCCKVGFDRVWPNWTALLQKSLPSHLAEGSGLYQGIWEALPALWGLEYILTPKALVHPASAVPPADFALAHTGDSVLVFLYLEVVEH